MKAKRKSRRVHISDRMSDRNRDHASQLQPDIRGLIERLSLKALRALVMTGLLSTVVFNSHLFLSVMTAKALWLHLCILTALPFCTYLLIINRTYRSNLLNPLTAAVLTYTGLSLAAGIAGVNASHSFWSDYVRMEGGINLFTSHVCM